MAIQTEDFNETVGLPGLIFPHVPHSIETGIIQDERESGGGFPLWGKKGEDGKVYSAKPESDGFLLGIAARTRLDALDEGYSAGDIVNVLKKGRVWVRVLGEVISGSAAYVNDSNNGITASSAGATAIEGGTFKTGAADGKLAQLEIA